MHLTGARSPVGWRCSTPAPAHYGFSWAEPGTRPVLPSRGPASPTAPGHGRTDGWDQPAATGCFLLTQAFNYVLSNCTEIMSRTKLNFLHGRMELECSFCPFGAHRNHPERWHSSIHKSWRLTFAPVNASQS